MEDKGRGLTPLRLSRISDDAQAEQLQIGWDAEISARRLEDDVWSRIG
jgi:hypothetical protein